MERAAPPPDRITHLLLASLQHLIEQRAVQRRVSDAPHTHTPHHAGRTTAMANKLVVLSLVLLAAGSILNADATNYCES